MRRSLRDAIVGFSILGGIVAFAGTMFWLRGVRFNAKTWSIKANFSDASGLSERSPVTYRGINVGSVGEISIMPKLIQATLEIEKNDLRLPRPVFAKVVNSSLLGGDVQIVLVSLGELVSSNPPLPGSKNCYGKEFLCEGEIIQGKPLSSIASLTAELESIVKKAGEEDIISNVINSTKQFDKTQKELEELITQAKEEIKRAEPIINELAEASMHINNILSAIDNPKTLNDIQETASSTRSLTRRIDNLGEDFEKLMEDEDLMNAFRSVTIGLGELFNELYPARINR